MTIASIVRQIDAEIDKLERARTILAGLLEPASRNQPMRLHTPETVEPTPAPAGTLQPPIITIVPPRVKRQYRRTSKPAAHEPRALASAVPAGPVFVPRAAATVHSEPVAAAFDSDAVEAALRQNLLGGVA